MNNATIIYLASVKQKLISNILILILVRKSASASDEVTTHESVSDAEDKGKEMDVRENICFCGKSE